MNESTLSILSLRGYGAAYGEKVVLAALDIEIPPTGPFVLMGPVGVGKTTLLRSLAGFNGANPAFRHWGEARYAGENLRDGHRPALPAQHMGPLIGSVADNLLQMHPRRDDLTPAQGRSELARICAEHGITELIDQLERPLASLPVILQRLVTLARLAATDPLLLCLDEPTRGLPGDDAQRLLHAIRLEGERRAVLVVLHNQEHADALGGQMALIAGGRVQEAQSTAGFLARPRSALGHQFLRTGSCAAPSPGAAADTLAEESHPPAPLPAAAIEAMRHAPMPRGFFWLKQGLLAGTPMPGLYHDIEDDLGALRSLGVTLLISLTQRHVDADALHRYGIDSLRHPIPDMQAPTVTHAWSICLDIRAALERGEVVAVHCRAGCGRVGTVLAAFLIHEGAHALDALEYMRCIDPRLIEADEQADFLVRFATIAHRRSGRQRSTRDGTSPGRADTFNSCLNDTGE